MIRLQIETVPQFYQRYVQHVLEQDMITALKFSQAEMNKVLAKVSAKNENYAYAEGKWTIKELLGHLCDAERVFTFRAMTFSRNDPNRLPGFDENAYVPESNATHRPLKDLVDELNNLRISTIDFFKSCSEDMLLRKGFANNTEISVFALGYVVSGHAIHHINILKERYLV